jgi:hypothetical protein
MSGRTLSLAAVRRLLLADPSKIDVRGAAVRIVAKRDGCSVAEARFGLAELREHVAVDRVYKLILPEEHAREKGSVALRRVNFFKAVQRRFPVDWDYLDMAHMEMGNFDDEGELTADDWFEYGIAIDSMRPFQDWGFARQWDKHPLVYQLADVLFMNEEWGAVEWNTARKWEHLVKKLRLDKPLKRGPDSIRTPMLRAFDNARGPIKYLPDARNILAFDTGSVFYDYDPEDGIEPWEWSRTSVEFLTGQAVIARRIEKQVAALEKWLDADPKAHAHQVLNYYTKHRRILEHESQQSDTDGPDARALINVLSGPARLAQQDEARRPI